MAARITLTLSLPPKGCSPNMESHRHWRERSAARSEHRGEAKVRLLRAVVDAAHAGIVDWKVAGNTPMVGHVVIHSEWFLGKKFRGDGRYRPRDIANAIAALKAAVDGFVDARLVKDDTAAYVSWGSTVLHSAKESGQRACVEITIEVKE
jgi:hypothetical protein